MLSLALLFRIAGAAARADEAPPLRWLGWAMSAAATWLVTGALGWFSPLGLAVLIGTVMFLVDGVRRRPWTWALGDVLVIAAAASTSIPRPELRSSLVLALVVMISGVVVDQLAARAPRRPRRALTLLPLLVWLAFGVLFPDLHEEFVDGQWPEVRPAVGPFFAVAAANVGEAVDLGDGVVGWLTLPPGGPPYRPAVVFHGADEEGAYQRGALFMRRTLLSLGYAVLAVDQPGFAASDPPRRLDELDAWDPDVSTIAATRHILAVPGVEGSILAVGHSMGATRAMRLIGLWPPASAAIVLGATSTPGREDDERLYGRFLDDFDVETSGLSMEFVNTVRDRYFNNDRAAQALPEGHAPVFFHRFTFEYENIIAGRDSLYEMIPGRKLEWEMLANHQFNASRVRGALIGDWRKMSQMRDAWALFLEGRYPDSGRRLPFRPRQ